MGTKGVFSKWIPFHELIVFNMKLRHINDPNIQIGNLPGIPSHGNGNNFMLSDQWMEWCPLGFAFSAISDVKEGGGAGHGCEDLGTILAAAPLGAGGGLWRALLP